jgi:hypothetical protein
MFKNTFHKNMLKPVLVQKQKKIVILCLGNSNNVLKLIHTIEFLFWMCYIMSLL